MVNRLYFFVFLLSLWCVSNAAALEVQTRAERTKIGVGESLQVQLRLDGSPDTEPDFTPLNPDWEILGRAQSSQFQIINGTSSHLVIYNLTLMPKRAGYLTLPALCFAKDCSQPLVIEVTDKPRGDAGQNERLILEADIRPRQSVTQAQLLLRVRLLRRVDLREGSLSEPEPAGVEAVVKKLGDEKRYETRREGQLYQVHERSYAIFPQESGTLKIPPLQFDGVLLGGGMRLDFLGRQQGQRVRVKSQPLQVEVSPPPADLGRRQWLPALDLELNDDWQQKRPNFVVGEPVTRTLRLRARGLQAAQLPALQPLMPDSFKTYTDQPTHEDRLVPEGLEGVLEQKIAIVPTRPGIFELPAVSLPWWDQMQQRWREAKLAALQVEVAPGAAPSAPSLVAPPPPSATPAAPPRSHLPAEVDAVPGFWPWLSLGLGLGWLLTLLWLWRSRRNQTTPLPKSVAAARPNEKAARLTVIQSATRNDAQQTRIALVAWSQTLWPELSVGAYEKLIQSAGAELQQELAQLDRHLYAREGQPWSGQRLISLIKTCALPAQTKQAVALPDLYPNEGN